MARIRAAVALALLGALIPGSWLCAVVVAVMAAWWWATSAGMIAASWTALSIVIAVLAFLLSRLIQREQEVPGDGVVLLPRSDVPLWKMVRELAATVDSKPPDEIRIVPGPYLRLTERTRRLGLVSGPRRLDIGLALLVGLTVGQLRSILVHELAHHSQRDGLLPVISHRARDAVLRVLGASSRRSLAGWIFRMYAGLVLTLEAPLSRRQELNADQAAVRVCGRIDTREALREMSVLRTVWQCYVEEYIKPAAKAGYAPVDVFDGFRRLLLQHRQETAELRGVVSEEQPAWWDPHPPLLERLAAIDRASDSASPTDRRPASMFLPALASAQREVEQRILGLADRVAVPWEEFSAIGASEKLRQEAAQLFDAASRLRGQPSTLEHVLDLLAQGRIWELAALASDPRAGRTEGTPGKALRLAAPTPRQMALVRRLLSSAFAVAAVDSGIARWRRSWSGAVQAISAEGVPLPVDELVAQVIADPATVPLVRDALRRASRAARVR